MAGSAVLARPAVLTALARLEELSEELWRKHRLYFEKAVEALRNGEKELAEAYAKESAFYKKEYERVSKLVQRYKKLLSKMG